MPSRIDVSLYAIIDETHLRGRDPSVVAADLAAGGATVIQYRAKELCSREFLSRAAAVAQALRGTQVPLIINDRVDIALLSPASGVHLGTEDVPVVRARELLGPERAIGATVRSPADVSRAEEEGADYLGAGAVFPSPTKSGVALIGLEGLAGIKARAKIPVVAVGGLTAGNARDVLSTGVDGLAFVSELLNSAEPGEVAGKLRAIIEQAKGERE